MKKTYPFILSTIILAIFLVISLVLGFSGHLFSLAKDFKENELTPGDSAVVQLNSNSSSSISYLIDGEFLNYEKIPISIKVRGANDKNVKVRARALVDDKGEERALSLGFTDDFVAGDDGYYYLKDVLNSQTIIPAVVSVNLEQDLRLRCDEKYIITILFETLDSELDAEMVWN